MARSLINLWQNTTPPPKKKTPLSIGLIEIKAFGYEWLWTVWGEISLSVDMLFL